MDKKKWVRHIPLYILEIIVLIGAVCVLYVTLKATDSKTGAQKDNLIEENIAVNQEVKEKIEETGKKEETSSYTGIFNVAFFGVDARDGSLGKGNRSDTIMICSIDMDTHEIRLISIYRDTYLNLGNDKYGKCNSAYAQGGPEQAIGMINMNTDMYVTDYITVGFEGLVKAVDALGGIEMELTETEIIHLNNYQSTMAEELDMDYTPIKEPGLHNLNGLQATAYCRIRYGGGDDFYKHFGDKWIYPLYPPPFSIQILSSLIQHRLHSLLISSPAAGLDFSASPASMQSFSSTSFLLWTTSCNSV